MCARNLWWLWLPVKGAQKQAAHALGPGGGGRGHVSPSTSAARWRSEMLLQVPEAAADHRTSSCYCLPSWCPCVGTSMPISSPSPLQPSLFKGTGEYGLFFLASTTRKVRCLFVCFKSKKRGVWNWCFGEFILGFLCALLYISVKGSSVVACQGRSLNYFTQFIACIEQFN